MSTDEKHVEVRSEPSFATFVINLDKDADRMAFMDEQLRSIGMRYERQAAVRPPDGVREGEYDEAEAVRHGGQALLPGELGCALSHKRAYETVLARGLDYGLVLEDDVELPSDFRPIVEREIRRNAGGWDYLLFDYWEPGSVSARLWFRSVGINLGKARARGLPHAVLYLAAALAKGAYVMPLFLFEGWRNRRKERSPGPVAFYRPLYLAGAYLVSAEGARKLLSLSSPIRYPADKLPNQARVRAGLRFRAYAPLCVRQLKRRFGSSMLGLSGEEIWGTAVPGAFKD